MSILSSTGSSRHRNPEVAAEEAVGRALQGLESTPLGLLLFAGIGYDQQRLVQRAWECAGRIPLAGCSGEGGLGKGWSDESAFWVVAMAFSGEGVSFRSGSVQGADLSPREAGRQVARNALLGGERALFLFPDGIAVDITGFQAGLGDSDVPILGGLAGDDWLEEGRTWQYCDGRAFSEAAAWLAVSGSVHVTWASRQGCEPFGETSRITRTDGNRILEIDGAPVMDFLSALGYAEDGPGTNPSLNIALSCELPDSHRQLMTHVVLPDIRDGSVPRTQIRLPEGTLVRLARRDPDSVRSGLSRIAHDLSVRLSGRTPKAILQVGCAGLGRLLFSQDQAQRNMRSLQQAIPGDPPWIGFYSYGEFVPDKNGVSCSHYTTVLAALSDP